MEPSDTVLYLMDRYPISVLTYAFLVLRTAVTVAHPEQECHHQRLQQVGRAAIPPVLYMIKTKVLIF